MSRVVLVRKIDDSGRVCINYRALNNLVEKDHFPLQLSKILFKIYMKITVLDLRKLISHHVDIKESS